jgi:hypothetical protein
MCVLKQRGKTQFCILSESSANRKLSNFGRKAIHSTRFARPCPSALCLNILLRRNGGRRLGCNVDVCKRNRRKEGPDVWQFRWSETRLDGKRFYHKKIVGTVEQYPDEDAARRSVVGLVSELNADDQRIPVS